jgi:carboxylesterase type B
LIGFLSTEDSVVQGNMGLKDQVVALKWTKQNIRQFSGDPNQVTIFGGKLCH